MSIVFYIRAKFEDSFTKDIIVDSINAVQAADKFSSLFKIDLPTYRKKIHEIQLSCLSKISNKVIYNLRERQSEKTPYLYAPYSTVQSNAIINLLQVKDDDIIVPLDDDDWVSPRLLDLDYRNEVTIWNSFSIGRSVVFYHTPNKAVPYTNLTEEELLHCEKLLSNCVAYKASLVKYTLKEIEYSRKLLQRHTQPRLLIREKVFTDMNIKETVLNDYLSVYVKHAGNITKLKALVKNDLDQYQKFNDTLDFLRSEKFLKAIDLLPEEYAWSKEYYLKLWELNQLL